MQLRHHTHMGYILASPHFLMKDLSKILYRSFSIECSLTLISRDMISSLIFTLSSSPIRTIKFPPKTEFDL